MTNMPDLSAEFKAQQRNTPRRAVSVELIVSQLIIDALAHELGSRGYRHQPGVERALGVRAEPMATTVPRASHGGRS